MGRKRADFGAEPVGRRPDLFRLLEEREDFFSLKLVYDTEDVLIHAVLDGKELALQNGIV